MRAAVIKSVGEIGVESVDEAAPGPRQAVVQVAAVGLCGTDLHILQGEFAPSLPLIPGHEFAGVVVATGPGVWRGRVRGHAGCDCAELPGVDQYRGCDVDRTAVVRGARLRRAHQSAGRALADDLSDLAAEQWLLRRCAANGTCTRRWPTWIPHGYPLPYVARAIALYAKSNAIIGGKTRVAGVTLKATDTDFSVGDGPKVSGPAISLLLAASGRKSALDEPSGPGGHHPATTLGQSSPSDMGP